MDDLLGAAVAINGDGSIVAVASPNERDGVGSIQVYQNTGASWSELGAKLEGMNTNQQFGRSIDISNDGYRLVVGSPASGNDSTPGMVQIFDYDITTGWQETTAIIGDTDTDKFGDNVRISADGSSVVVGIAITALMGSMKVEWLKPIDWWEDYGLNMDRILLVLL